MKVVVTGGHGFLGSHLVERLERDDHNVFAVRHADYDLTAPEDAARLFADTTPELVFHLAAEVGGIGANRSNPGLFWHANLAMGLNVLEQARLHETPKLVIAGTVCAYPKFAPIPFREENLWDGYPEETNAPYGIAKKALLVGAQAYREQYGLNTIFLLPTNLYGPRDDFDLETSHVIPALIRKMIEAGDEDVVLWGDGSPTREFLYAEDCADGFVLAAERYHGPEPVNLGAAHEISIRELAELIANVTGYHGEIVWDKTMPNGQPRRSVDGSRARELFGFDPRTTLARGTRADRRLVSLGCGGRASLGELYACSPTNLAQCPTTASGQRRRSTTFAARSGSVRGADGPRHRRGRLRRLAPDRRARRAWRERPRLRPRHLERGAE